MRSDTYLLLTCKHSPRRRIQIGSGKHAVTQWRCACGRIVPLSDLQIMYVATLQSLLSERESMGTLSDYREAAIAGRLNDFRNEMSKREQGQLDSIIQAVVNSRPKARAS